MLSQELRLVPLPRHPLQVGAEGYITRIKKGDYRFRRIINITRKKTVPKDLLRGLSVVGHLVLRRSARTFLKLAEHRPLWPTSFLQRYPADAPEHWSSGHGLSVIFMLSSPFPRSWNGGPLLRRKAHAPLRLRSAVQCSRPAVRRTSSERRPL